MIEYTYWPQVKWLAGCGILLSAAVFASYYSAKGHPHNWARLAAGGLRWFSLGAILFCLLDPEWVEAIKHQRRARLAVLLDCSRSMSITDLPKGRLTAAKDWLGRRLAPKQVPPNVDVDYYTFEGALAPVPSIDKAKAEGEATGLADALENVLSVKPDETLTGVLVCSDGIENVRKAPEAIARTYRRKGIPIHTLVAGTTNDMRDVILENVQARRSAPNRAPTKVTVDLRAPGYTNEIVPVQILQQNQMVAVQDVRLTGGMQKVELDFTPRQKGFQVYEARIPAQPGEWQAANNRRLFGLDVIDPTIRVIYMEGTPQQPNSPIPEWKYLKSALESDPDIKVTTLYRKFGATGKQLDVVDRDPETGEKIYPLEHPTRGFPRTLSKLLEYDVVIHSDIRKESFSPEQLQNMARLVEEFGGGFVMIGGNSAFGKGGYHRTVLDRIIPVAMRQENDSEARPFPVFIPPLAWSHPIIAFGRTRQETEAIWTKKLPLFYGCNVVDRAKPGAVVLGYNPTVQGARAGKLVLAVQNIGRGRSMAFTPDTTRTWGKDFETLWGEAINPSLPLEEFNCDSRYYRRFWVNAVRWLAASRIGRSNNIVTLELSQSHCAPNEKVTVSVKVRDKDLKEVTSADVSILASSATQTNQLAKATFDAQSHSFLAQIELHDPGEFTICAVASGRGIESGDDRQLLVCERTDMEMRDPVARPDLMATLARLSGGQRFSLSAGSDEDVGLTSLFHNAPPPNLEYRRSPLWSRAWILAAILGLLSAEWAIRRLNGMA